MLVIAGIAAMLLGFVLLLQVPAVQTKLASRVLDTLKDKFDGRISVGSVNILPFNTLILKDVLIQDDNPREDTFVPLNDTLLYVRSAIANFSLQGIKGLPIILRKASADGVVMNLSLEEDRQMNLKRVLRLKEPGPEPNTKDVFHIRHMNLKDVRFCLANVRKPAKDSLRQGIDYRYLDLYSPSIKASNLDIAGGHTKLTVDEAEVYDRCGYHVKSFNGFLDVSRGDILLGDMHAIDEWSDVRVPELRLRKIDEVMHYSARAENTMLDGRSFGYVVGAPGRFSFLADLKSANLEGPLKDLRISNIDFRDKSGIALNGSLRIVELNDRARASAEADIRRLEFTTSGVEELVASMGVKAPQISNFAFGENMVLKAHGKGPLNRLHLDGNLSSGLGELACSLGISHLMDNRPVNIEGTVDSRDLDIGAILSKGPVRECTLHAAVQAELSGDNSRARIDTLLVDRLHILGYDYTALAAAGTFSGKSFDGRIICSDPNLNFLFQGLFNLSRKTSNALYKFYLNLGYADLNALGFDKREISKAAATVNANYMRISSGELLGDVAVRHINLESVDGSYDIGDIDISSNYSNGTHRVALDSDFMNASLISDHNPLNAIDILRSATIQRALPALCKPGTESVSGRLDMQLQFSDIQKLLNWIKPGAYIADGSRLALHITPDGNMDANVSAQRIAIKDKFVKDLSIEGRGSGNSMTIKGRSSEIFAGGPFRLAGNILNASAGNDHIDAGYSFNKEGQSSGDLLIGANLWRDEEDSVVMDAYTLPSSVSGDFGDWDISSSNLMVKAKDISISGLKFSSGDQSATLNGGLSYMGQDTLRLAINNVDISMLKGLVGADIAGRLDGEGYLASPYAERLDLNLDAISKDTRLSGHEAGTLHIGAGWDSGEEGFRFAVDDEILGRNSIAADALYIPSSHNIDASVDLQSLNLGYFSDFLGELGNLEGAISGRLGADGPVDDLSLISDGTRLEDVKLAVGMTGVTYHLDGPVGISNEGVNLEGVSITDGNGGRGRLSGGISYDRLRDARADISASLSDIKVFNITEVRQDTDIYGELAVRGSVKLSGPLDRLKLDVDARDSGNSYLHVPIKSGTVNSTNLLTFKQEEVWVDPYEQMLQQMQEQVSKDSDIDIRLRVRPSPSFELTLDLDRSSGNSISARGSGDINVNIAPAKDIFNVGGDYNINSGNVHFSALGIASRDFSIKNGSSIKFGGDIMDSELNVDASYTTKVSLANLIADTTSVSTRRNVICGINISDKFRNPQLKFSIDVPDLDPTISSSVSNALNTEDKVQRQFLALLVTGNFLPNDQSGIVNNSNMLYSNVTEIMAGQLNNILQRLDIPLDLGLSYQPNEGGTDIFDVAVSTQLFNNRVTVNGTIGNRDEAYSANGSDMAGDLDIGIKLDKAGAVQMSLFSHSADLYTNYLDNLQRNGVGIGYQREFRNLKELWQGIFRSKKKRDAFPGAREERERTTISIESDER